MLNEQNNIRLNLTIFFLIIAAYIIYTFIMPDIVLANDGGESMDKVVEKFKAVFNDEKSNKITMYLFERAKFIFYMLALIQLSWSLMHLAMEGRLEMQSVVLAATKQLLIIGIMYWLLTNAQDFFNGLIDGFNNAGKTVTQTTTDNTASQIVKLGVDTVGGLFTSLSQAEGNIGKVPQYIIVGICSVIILLSFAFAALTFIIAQCKVYMSAMVAIFFMGFGANDYTRNIAITAFKGVLCAVIELFTLHILFAMGKEVFTSFFDDVSKIKAKDIITIASQLVIATFVYTSALKTLPQFASGILAGSPMGGGSAMGSGGALAGAVAGGVATGLTTAIGGGLAGKGALAAAKAAGTTSKSALFGKAMLGAARGGFAAKQRGLLGNITTDLAKDDIQMSLGIGSQNQNNGQQQNSASAPSQNSNNVSP